MAPTRGSRRSPRLPWTRRWLPGAALAWVLAVACGLLMIPASLAAPGGQPGVEQLRAKAAALRAEIDSQNDRLEQLAEELKEAYANGVELLAEAARIEQRRAAADRDHTTVRQQLDERIRSTYIEGPASYLSELIGAGDPAEALRRLPLQKAVIEADLSLVERTQAAKAKVDALNAELQAKLLAQARMAQDLAGKEAEARALAAKLEAKLRTLDKQMKRLIEEARAREEAGHRTAFAQFMAGAQASGRIAADATKAAPAAKRAVEIALAQLGAPYRWGATGPNEFDCSGLTSSSYGRAGVAIPRTSKVQYAALAARGQTVGVASLLPGDLVFYAYNPADPATIHHVGMYVGRGLMVEAPYTGAFVRTASVWRRDLAGAVRPVPALRP